jgi:hypothetical protein
LAQYSLSFMPQAPDLPEIHRTIAHRPISDFPSFHLLWRYRLVARESPARAKLSDLFDEFYLALVPCVTLYTCDSAVLGTLDPIVRSDLPGRCAKLASLRTLRREIPVQ